MDIELRQPRPLSGESVQIRRGDRSTVEPRVVPVHVVGKKDDDVRARRFRARNVARHNEPGHDHQRNGYQLHLPLPYIYLDTDQLNTDVCTCPYSQLPSATPLSTQALSS